MTPTVFIGVIFFALVAVICVHEIFAWVEKRKIDNFVFEAKIRQLGVIAEREAAGTLTEGEAAIWREAIERTYTSEWYSQ